MMPVFRLQSRSIIKKHVTGFPNMNTPRDFIRIIMSSKMVRSVMKMYTHYNWYGILQYQEKEGLPSIVSKCLFEKVQSIQFSIFTFHMKIKRLTSDDNKKSNGFVSMTSYLCIFFKLLMYLPIDQNAPLYNFKTYHHRDDQLTQQPFKV